VTTASDKLVVSRTSGFLGPDPRRVVARLFVPGHELLVHGQSRATPVLERILALDEDVVATTLASTMDKFAARYDDLPAVLAENFAAIAHRVGASDDLPEATRLLVGAYFTHEYSIESAALFNPSMVLHPDQSDLMPGEARVVLSLRAVGEGHLSSIEFRTGIADADGHVSIDESANHLVVGRPSEATFDRRLFHRALNELGDAGEDAAYVLETLPDPFTAGELDHALATLYDQLLTRHTADRTIEHLRWVASCNYQVGFPEETSLSQRVLMPVAPTETHGMEDARFVRFTDDDGTVTYYATYTAFDGAHVAPQMLKTIDFNSFRISQLAGAAAVNKGMALFPRRINGRYVALSRWDRENNAITTSADGHVWDDSTTVQTPVQPWELIQLGNCGSPIETAAGWLVLTHGVGPMRSYAIGAVLLDLEDPTRVIGRLTDPLLSPTETERDGYVPNVVYSCGALAHGGRLIVPYGCADSSIGIAVIDLPELLDQVAGHRTLTGGRHSG
jgi:predicted GH43/DUF377 family glycosyl hydrolase